MFLYVLINAGPDGGVSVNLYETLQGARRALEEELEYMGYHIENGEVIGCDIGEMFDNAEFDYLAGEVISLEVYMGPNYRHRIWIEEQDVA